MLGIHYHSKNTLLHSELNNFKCVQIFRSSVIPDIKGIIYVHAPYNLNVWKTKNKNNEDQIRAFGYFKSEITKCQNYAKGYIMHLPSGENIPELMEIARTTKILLKILKKLNNNKVKLLLEMPAAKHGKFEKPEKINALIAAVDANQKNFGICIDTAHLWGMGEDISSYKNAQKWFDLILTPNFIGMIHLNGSSVEFNCGMDVHEIAFSDQDKIWNKIKYEDSGLSYIIEFTKKYKLPIILEINRGTLPDFKKLIYYLTKKGGLSLA